ncbi:hypothetical protein K504DRAFT_465738 [Pleomassaria siparia CBS 279.74]|uniref:Heterokaryon incompatibility domain-containing protein n=1 Tax=Pleomassaria siparia CBS 279.74 TaxID=1314801 RepID=A0A6G1KCR5_9PLEO|nr:hypothetical protein K504DRAFT_465738 [Pleomassaria siparia CBS 279.74]
MAEWEQAGYERYEYGDPDSHFLAPGNPLGRPRSTRSPRSRDVSNPGLPRRQSLHRSYHSDDETRPDLYGLAPGLAQRVPSPKRVPSPPPSRYRADEFLIPLVIGEEPVGRHNRHPSRKHVPSPSSFFRQSAGAGEPLSEEEVDDYDTGPIRSEGQSQKRIEWARKEQDRLAASHALSERNVSPDAGPTRRRRKSVSSTHQRSPSHGHQLPGYAMPRGEDLHPSPSVTGSYNRAPSPPKASYHRVPSPPRVEIRPHSTQYDKPGSYFKRTPSPPPPVNQRRKSENVSRSRRQSSPHVPYRVHEDDQSYYSVTNHPPKGRQTRGTIPEPDGTTSFSVPGAFPSGPATIAPDDSGSGASQPHHKTLHRPSIAHRPTPSVTSSSGTLGDKAYQYKPLGDFDFRLIRILPARMMTIKCELLHFSLKKPPSYRAISYARGDAGDTRKIMLEGMNIPVPVSLHGALEALREKKEGVLVWVDFLCIDQQNRDEKAQQLQYMTSIYSKADSVALWLGPEADESDSAVKLLNEISTNADYPERITSLIKARVGDADFAAIASLFERDYWRRLWVVQEILNAKDIWVYCGTVLHWSVYKKASLVFQRHKNDLDYYFQTSKRRGQRHSPNQSSFSQALVYQGPGSLPELGSLTELGDESLLHVMRALRRKITSDPRDKVYGILGVLPQTVRSEFPVDLSLSVREVYIDVVDYLLSTTEYLDVICESIHFPVHTNSANLPTWAPDWSHSPQTAALGSIYDFSASGTTRAEYRFVDERRNKLEISAIYVDTITTHGIAVGTLCTLADYLMAFLHWRALLVGGADDYGDDGDDLVSVEVENEFCRTLSLGQVPPEWDDDGWRVACYHVFSSLLRERLPRIKLDTDLQLYLDTKVEVNPKDRRGFLQKHFGSKMMGRCFCQTEDGLMGMGSGFMTPGDIIVVPLGCSTPIILRREGNHGEWRYVGDVFIDGYMNGEAVKEWKAGDRERAPGKYILH